MIGDITTGTCCITGITYTSKETRCVWVTGVLYSSYDPGVFPYEETHDSVREAAESEGVSVSTVYRLIRTGKESRNGCYFGWGTSFEIVGKEMNDE